MIKIKIYFSVMAIFLSLFFIIFVQAIYPNIISQTPSNGQHITGSSAETFSVKYSEENLDRVELYWDKTWPYSCSYMPNCLPVTLTNCGSGIEKTCSVNLDLSNYKNGDEIKYYFGVFQKNGPSVYIGEYKVIVERNVCTPKTCSQLGKECSSWDNGCGTTMDCGICSSGKFCQEGKCVSLPYTPTCTERETKNLRCENNNKVWEECIVGGWVTATKSCSDENGKCENGVCIPCIPKICSQLGKECGNWDNDCSVTINCGSCSSGKTCQNGLCVSSGSSLLDEKTKDINKSKEITNTTKIETSKETCEEDDIKYYNCSNNMNMVWCQCLSNNWVCIDSPESQCEKECSSGCLHKETCYPITSRTEIEGTKVFCSIINTFKEQKEGWEKCDENYECKSNLCLEGECTSVKGVAQEVSKFKIFFSKIMCRIANLFNIQKYESCVSSYIGNVSEGNTN